MPIDLIDLAIKELPQVYAAAAFGAATAAAATVFASRRKRKFGSRGKTIRRQRQTMQAIYEELGPRYFRQAYRMKFSSFVKLSNLLGPTIIRLARKEGADPTIIRSARNGRIHHSLRLGCALRFFAGASVYDLMTTFGIGRTDIGRSIWLVVEAIHLCNALAIKYPDCHVEQQKIAMAFKAKSSADIDCCAGAVDGLLIWIHRPSEKQAELSTCSPQKFMCGRKHKFGLNLQAICDARGRFLDVSVMFPGSTSDVLSFESSAIYTKLEDGLLAPSLCIFGDNAYINTRFMATPYTGVSGGTKDAYNFYHSQLRINIECAFGRLVHRWAILRSAIPMNISIGKTTALVVALTKLHNFCIDENENELSVSTPGDALNIDLSGGVPMEPSVQANMSLPMGLMGGGEHFDDMDRNTRRRREREATNDFPRDRLHEMIAVKGLTRPAPTRQRH